MTTNDFSAAYTRLLSVTGSRTQVELADILGIRQSSIPDAKRRGEIPAGWLLKVLTAYSVNPEWIVTGEGPQYLAEVDTQPKDVKRVNWHALSQGIEGVQKRACSEIMTMVRDAMHAETQA